MIEIASENERLRRLFVETVWIGGKGDSFCRKTFDLTPPPVSAILYIIADCHTYNGKYGWMIADSFLKYRLFLNGKQFGVGPFRPITDSVPVAHRFDVTELLKNGTNVLGVVSRGRLKGYALFVEMVFEDGETMVIRSGAEWRRRDGDSLYDRLTAHNPGTNLFANGAVGPGEIEEHIIGENYPVGWLSPDYDDSSWALAETHGACHEQFELSTGSNYELKTVKPVMVEKKGESHFHIDFGCEIAAGLELDAPPLPGQVEIRLGEELTEDGHVRHVMRTKNHYRDIWNFSGKNQTLSHFGLRAFRYAEILGWHGGDLTADKIRATTVTMPFSESDSSFTCSSQELETVWRFCKNTIRQTTMDLYQDCPSRERIAYEADTYINMLSHFAVEGNITTAKRTFEYQLKHPTWPCEWRQFAIPIAYEYLMHTGDYETVDRYFEFLRDSCSFHNLLENGLIKQFPMRIIIDWPENYRDDYEIADYCAVPNAFAYYDLVLLAELTKLLNRSGGDQFLVLAEEMKTAFNSRLYDDDKRLYRDGAESRHCSFHANMFPLCFGLVPESRVKTCLDFIERRGMACSVYAAQFYLEALFKHGRAESAIALMTSDDVHRSWLGMIRQGATTTMEAWNPQGKPNLSWAHPWATAPANIISRHLFGLRPTVPGWKDFVFVPHPGKLDAGEITIPTPRGRLSASFRMENGQYVSSVCFEQQPETQRISQGISTGRIVT